MNVLDEFMKTLPYTPKRWGGEYLIVNDEKYCAKFLKVNPGYQCSLHYHKIKRETFKILSGTVDLELDGDSYSRTLILTAGDEQLIRPYTYHRFSTKTGAIILEISTHHEDSDSYRLEESKKIDDPKSS
jgi:mannose-6-phosphate isomerase-like protein (cupin superfamily)